jgi:hypothetical protein
LRDWSNRRASTFLCLQVCRRASYTVRSARDVPLKVGIVHGPYCTIARSLGDQFGFIRPEH